MINVDVKYRGVKVKVVKKFTGCPIMYRGLKMLLKYFCIVSILALITSHPSHL